MRRKREHDHDRWVRQGIFYPPGRQLTPLERLLIEINDPYTTTADRWRAMELAMPYCHAPKSAEPSANFEFGNLRTASQILAAQRKVMIAVGKGTLPAALGKMMIDSLRSMIESFAATTLESRLEEVEHNAQGGRPQLTVVHTTDDDDEAS